MPMVPNLLFWSLPPFWSRYSFSIACYLGNILYFHVKGSIIKLSSFITPPKTNNLFPPLFEGSCSVNGSRNSPHSWSKLSQQPIILQDLQLPPPQDASADSSMTLSSLVKLLSEPSLWFCLVWFSPLSNSPLSHSYDEGSDLLKTILWLSIIQGEKARLLNLPTMLGSLSLTLSLSQLLFLLLLLTYSPIGTNQNGRLSVSYTFIC